jgi:general secretion pathway protein K
MNPAGLLEKNPSSGIALVAVMVVLAILSAIALGLATSVQNEARIEAAEWDGLQAEQLARSGQEFAAFLEARGLRKTADFMAGLPFEAVNPGFRYRAPLRNGTVDIYFEADSGKLDLSNAPEETLINFFSLWTGDFTKAQLIAAAIEDWRDTDNDVRPNGAETSAYSMLGYGPRNGGIGLGDAPLIRGLTSADFQPGIQQQRSIPKLRPGLDEFVTTIGPSNTINPNFAPDLVLKSVPGLSESQVETILLQRRDHLYDSADDFQSRIGLSSNSTALRYLNFGRLLPAILSVAKMSTVDITRSERRVMSPISVFNPSLGMFESKSVLGRVQRNQLFVYPIRE